MQNALGRPQRHVLLVYFCLGNRPRQQPCAGHGLATTRPIDGLVGVALSLGILGSAVDEFPRLRYDRAVSLIRGGWPGVRK